MLVHSFIERLFYFPDVQICAVLAASNRINYITRLCLGVLPLGWTSFCLIVVGRFKINLDLMFIEDPPEFLRYSHDIKNDNVLKFFRGLSVRSGSFRESDNGPVWVATDLKCSPDVLLFLLLPLFLCGHDHSPVA